MSERNAKLIRRWARRTGIDPHHPDNGGMWRIFRGNDPRRKAALRRMLRDQIFVTQLVEWSTP